MTVRRTDSLLKIAPACALAFLLVALGSSCTGAAPGAAPAPDTTGAGLDSVIAEIQAYQPPAGTAGFEELRSGLLDALASRHVSKVAAVPPHGATNAIDDLAVNNVNGSLSWTYANTGDYDQNGEVNVADLTPIAVHFLKTPAAADWAEAQVADGDGNDEVNAADITPIALYYLSNTTSYNIYTSDSPDDHPTDPDAANGTGAALAGTIDFALADTPPGFKTFTYQIPAPVDLNYYWVRPSDSVNVGAASNAVQYEAPINPNDAPDAVLDATPTSGEGPLTVNFDASASTDTDGMIVKFEWDWDGAVGGFIWEDTGTTATNSHEYTGEGIYNPVLRVTDDLGATDTATIQIEVTPPVIIGHSVSGKTWHGFPPTPIEGVIVHIESVDGAGYSDTTTSDSNGDYSFENIPDGGKYDMWCEHPDWIWPGPRHVPLTGDPLTADITDFNFAPNGPA